MEYRPLVVFGLIVTPIDDVEKLPCMTNDRSNSIPLNQRLFHKPHILVRSTLHFLQTPDKPYGSTHVLIPPNWNGGSLPNTSSKALELLK